MGTKPRESRKEAARSNAVSAAMENAKAIQERNAMQATVCKRCGATGGGAVCPPCRVALADESEARELMKDPIYRAECDAAHKAQWPSISEAEKQRAADALAGFPPIPMYQIRLNHPAYGWQVVATADTLTGAKVLRDYWIANTAGRCPVNLAVVSTVNAEVWNIIYEYNPVVFALTGKGGNDETEKG